MSASCEFKTSNLENAYHVGFREDPVNCDLVGTQQTLALVVHLKHLSKVPNAFSGQRAREDQILGMRRC